MTRVIQLLTESLTGKERRSLVNLMKNPQSLGDGEGDMLVRLRLAQMSACGSVLHVSELGQQVFDKLNIAGAGEPIAANDDESGFGPSV